MVNILLTSAGGELSPLISQNFKNIKKFKKVTTVGIDVKNQNVNKHFFDYFYKVSKKKSKYLSDIKRIIRKNKLITTNPIRGMIRIALFIS